MGQASLRRVRGLKCGNERRARRRYSIVQQCSLRLELSIRSSFGFRSTQRRAPDGAWLRHVRSRKEANCTPARRFLLWRAWRPRVTRSELPRPVGYGDTFTTYADTSHEE